MNGFSGLNKIAASTIAGWWDVILANTDNIAKFLKTYEEIAIVYVFIANTSYLIILIAGYINARRLYAKSKVSLARTRDISSTLLPISILIPAYNEERNICESIQSMLRLNYPSFELIVVNDGSTDDTLKALIEHFELVKVELSVPHRIKTNKIQQVYKAKNLPLLTVIDKANGGKADALNCGVNYSVYPLVCCVDSDSIFEESGLIQLAIPFFEYQEEVIAVGGAIRVGNDFEISHGKIKDVRIGNNIFAIIQVVEYLRAFLVGRMGWDFFNANTIISGAFGLFRKKAIIEVGGYTRATIGEDLELLLKMHMHYKKNKLPYQVKFLPDPVCWTEVPTDLKTLGNQRSRWQQGLAEGLRTTWGMMFRSWSGVIGWIALPYLWLFEMISAPIELLGYLVAFFGLATGMLELKTVSLFLLVSMVYGWVLTFGAVVIEERTFRRYKSVNDYLKLCLGAFIEPLGFRQLHLYWRLRGIWRHLRGRSAWGVMKRTGFKKK